MDLYDDLVIDALFTEVVMSKCSEEWTAFVRTKFLSNPISSQLLASMSNEAEYRVTSLVSERAPHLAFIFDWYNVVVDLKPNRIVPTTVDCFLRLRRKRPVTVNVENLSDNIPL